MRNTIFDFDAFAKITNELMSSSPDRPRALMVENNAYYMLVNMHILLCNMVEFADVHDSGLSPSSMISRLKLSVSKNLRAHVGWTISSISRRISEGNYHHRRLRSDRL